MTSRTTARSGRPSAFLAARRERENSRRVVATGRDVVDLARLPPITTQVHFQSDCLGRTEILRSG